MQSHRWQLQEAKARFSQLVKAAIEHGPQEVSVRGEPAVVVISKHDFDRLSGMRPRFVDFIRQSPLAGVELRLERDRSPVRDVDL